MNYHICDSEQGTEQWLADRLGCVTGSMADVLYAAGKKGEESTQRVNYRYQLAEERVTGKAAQPGFISEAMKWGTEHEPYARMAYEGLRYVDVQSVGFIRLDGIWAGCSLDGYVGNMDGIVEIKCPMLKTHIAYLKAGVIPPEYRYQVTHNLWCTGAAWCDFVSFRPGFQLFVVRAHAADMPIAEHGEQVRRFLAEVDAVEQEIRKYAIAEEI